MTTRVKNWSDMTTAERAEFAHAFNYGKPTAAGEVVCLGDVNDSADMALFGETEWTVEIQADGSIVATPHMCGALPRGVTKAELAAMRRKYRAKNPPIRFITDGMLRVTYMT